MLPGASSADSWRRTGSLATKRSENTVTVLPNGQVLFAGGFDTDLSKPFNSVEAYDPLTGRWSTKASMSTAREDAVAVLLTDGRILVAGGSDGTHSLKSAEIYDPSLNAWSNAGDMSAGRNTAVAHVLADGRVMVAGGYDDLGGGTTNTVDIYNPVTNAWSNTGLMGQKRQIAGIVQLPDGQVLVAGGIDAPPTAETWDPATNLWTPTTNDMSTPRANSPFALTLLANGKPLFAGGGTPPQGGTDVYDPSTRQWSAVGNLATPRQFADAVLLRNGRVLAVGGLRSAGALLAVAETAELFNPATGKWSAAAKPTVPLSDDPASVLCDGRVLLAGGIDKYTGGFAATNAAELYTPTLARPLNGELLVNGNAEAGAATDTDHGVVPPVGWVVTPNFTAGKYNPSYFPAPPGSGSNFFAGGPGTPSSRACQGVDVSQAAARIDAGLASVNLAADLGGFANQLDQAAVTATFRGAGGHAISQLVLQPVTESERGGVTKAIHRLASKKIPAGTRSIEVVISTIRMSPGSYDDGYADNVALRLKSTPLPLPKLTKLKLKPSSFRAGTKRKDGTTVSFADSRAGTVRFTVARRASGRKVGGKCVKKTKKNAAAKRCTRFVPVGSFVHGAHAGANAFHFAGLIAGKRLNAARYRLTALPRNAEGRAGRAASRSFSVVR